MKMKRLLALLVAALMLFAAVSCDKGGKGGDTTANTTTEAAPTNADTPTDAPTDAPTAAPTAAPTEGPTAAPTEPETDAPVNSFGQLTDAELLDYKLLLPVILPDNTADYTFTRVMCMDDGLDNYLVEGNSSGHTSFVEVADGALYGQAAKIQAYGKDTNNRCEITLKPNNELTIEGAKGVLFWVDFSHVTIVEEGKLCASVTINTNDYRSTHGAVQTSIGYYWDGFTWVETTNINACRMLLPSNFKGWVYVPATSYWYNKGDKVDGLYPTQPVDANGCFTADIPTDLLSFNMRCYTDGYQYSNDPDQYVIFDEILFIYG